MKVLVRYSPQDDEDDELETSFSLTLPKAWLAGPAEKLRVLFVDHFNKKHGAEALPLDKADCRLETAQGKVIPDDGAIEQHIKEGEELFVRRSKVAGASPAKSATPAAQPKQATTAPAVAPQTASTAASTPASADGSVPCKRFGCGKRFIPGMPSDEPCKHHKKPPVFHETRKYWACCPDKVAWDWDSFQALEGCETLPEHTNVTDASKQKVMGGTELRAEIQGPKEIVQERKITSLDKLMALRTALVNIGVRGDVFDNARDAIKRVHEDTEGKQVWDKVCSELTQVFEGTLNSQIAKTQNN